MSLSGAEQGDIGNVVMLTQREEESTLRKREKNDKETGKKVLMS